MPETADASVERVTIQPNVSTEGDKSTSVASWIVLAAGVATIFFAAALTIRTYMPCPYWDEWDVISQIAQGAKPTSLQWLWSQHNEHRIAMTRLLIWLDCTAFGAKNISLFFELYAAQVMEWALLGYVVERATRLPVSLKRTLQGIFAFSLFHPNQAENLTWAFQVSFVLCFLIGTATLMAVAFWNSLADRLRPFAAAFVALGPLLAALNLSGGLLIGPVAVALACCSRVPRRLIASWTVLYGITFTTYFIGYHADGDSPLASLRHPLGLMHYVLRYLDASWQLMIPIRSDVPAFLSLMLLALFIVRAMYQQRSRFEIFCMAQCSLIVLTASVTALGRYHFGIEQAEVSRYQTAAMLYWASLGSLMLIRYWRSGAMASKLVASVILVGWLFFPLYWMAWTARRNAEVRACTLIRSDAFLSAGTGILHPKENVLRSGASLLLREWR